MLAFSKVMKKYDKVPSLHCTLPSINTFGFLVSQFLEFYLQITSRNASKTYLQILDMSSLGSSDEVCNATSFSFNRKEQHTSLVSRFLHVLILLGKQAHSKTRGRVHQALCLWKSKRRNEVLETGKKDGEAQNHIFPR